VPFPLVYPTPPAALCDSLGVVISVVAVVGNELVPEEAVNGAGATEDDAPILPMNHAGTHPRSPVSCLILHVSIVLCG
jgi:hypothetical protein